MDNANIAKFLESLDVDEGCVLEIEDTSEARGLSTGQPLLKNGPQNMLSRLTTEAVPKSSKDSGFSSRMSEADGDPEDRARRSLLAEHKKDLNKRLTRISECQYDESCRCTPASAIKAFIKIVGVFTLLYAFICTLDLLSNAFRLLGGKTAGSVFSNSVLLRNPITGLMIGVLATVILQSSSTSSSIVITMVASNIIELQPAIPIIMGANIGTTVTNTLVSLAHSMNHNEFRRAFSGAVVHDVFNWLTVLILLPLEYCTGYLYHLTGVIISSLDMEEMKYKNQDLLKKLTKPLTSRIVQVDKSVITGIAEGLDEYRNKSILKVYCTFKEVPVAVNQSFNDSGEISWNMVNQTSGKKMPLEKCNALFSHIGWNDTSSGGLLFICSIVLLSLCLYLMVKLLHSLLGGQIAKTARKTINADFPRPFHWLTGYVAIIVGAGMTILVQSSSVFTSALTPLVGIGCLKLERMFPLTLGSNIGTTFTGILAALASSSATMSIALQLAFCHLFFNITGILIFYPVPKMRKIVLNTAKYLGRTTAQYRWFAIAYLICMFLLFPSFFFVLSFAGQIPFIVSLCIIGALTLFIVVVNVMQRNKKSRYYLPKILQTWAFLPEIFRSLAPIDRCIHRAIVPFSKCCCQCCISRCSCLTRDMNQDVGYLDSDSEDSNDVSAQSSYLPSAVSSKMFLASSSYIDLKTNAEPRRIYKPRDVISRKNSIGGVSPVLGRNPLGDRTNQIQEPEATQKAASFYISENEKNLLNTDGATPDTQSVLQEQNDKPNNDLREDSFTNQGTSINIDRIRESII